MDNYINKIYLLRVAANGDSISAQPNYFGRKNAKIHSLQIETVEIESVFAARSTKQTD